MSGGPGIALLIEDFEAWPPPGNSWSFAAVAGGTIGVSEVAPHGGLKQLVFDSMSANEQQRAVLKLDLAAVASATDLAAEFWARTSGGQHARVYLDLSGDGAAWTTAMEAAPGADYARFALDLDQALAAAAIAPDADVYVRLRHQGLSQDLFVDDVRIGRGLDLLGPTVVAQSPTTVSSTGGPLNQFSVTFDEAIDPTTLTVDDVSVWDPNGAAITVLTVDGGVQSAGGGSSTRYFISFADQTKRGVYRFSVGPNVTDLAGNLMNQDGDFMRATRRTPTRERSTTRARRWFCRTGRERCIRRASRAGRRPAIIGAFRPIPGGWSASARPCRAAVPGTCCSTP